MMSGSNPNDTMPDEDKKKQGIMNAFKAVLAKIVAPSPELKQKTLEQVGSETDHVDRAGNIIPRTK